MVPWDPNTNGINTKKLAHFLLTFIPYILFWREEKREAIFIRTTIFKPEQEIGPLYTKFQDKDNQLD